MVKLTAVHYGFDNDIFPKNFKPKTNAIDTIEKSSTGQKEPNVEKTNIASIPKSTSGRVKKSLRKKKKALKAKKDEVNGGRNRMTRTKPRSGFTCDNCGEISNTLQTFNLHKSQDFC